MAAKGTTYKLRKGQNLGALAAENDRLLGEAFYDSGILDQLIDVTSPRCIVLGRTGAGKTALLGKIEADSRNNNVSRLDPEDLSMQYLQNSTILKTLQDWGVNLEIFYKYLWRHICVLELIRMRYSSEKDVPTGIYEAFKEFFVRGGPEKNEKKTMTAARNYLEAYGNEYWIRSDTRIKTITKELEDKVSNDARISGKIRDIEMSAATGSSHNSKVVLESEVAHRAQEIVRDFLIADLNRVLDALAKNGFSDPQKPYFLVIDDLDKNWMPDDSLYLDLLRALLIQVAELNRRIQNVKVIVALRENIFVRLLRKAALHDQQREKWKDVIISISWTREQLAEMADKRLACIFREQYTSTPPTLQDILPKREQRKRSSKRYILDRTFLRPRDVIDFLNRCLDRVSVAGFERISWGDITSAEVEYSKERLDFVCDEWRDSFPGLGALQPLLSHTGKHFSTNDIEEDVVGRALDAEKYKSSEWLRDLRDRYLNGDLHYTGVVQEFMFALYMAGIIGFKGKGEGRSQTVYSWTQSGLLRQDLMLETMQEGTFHVHEMFWQALNYGPDD